MMINGIHIHDVISVGITASDALGDTGAFTTKLIISDYEGEEVEITLFSESPLTIVQDKKQEPVPVAAFADFVKPVKEIKPKPRTTPAEFDRPVGAQFYYNGLWHKQVGAKLFMYRDEWRLSNTPMGEITRYINQGIL